MKVAQIFGNLLAHFEKVKIAVATFGEIGLLFSLLSGHTACKLKPSPVSYQKVFA